MAVKVTNLKIGLQSGTDSTLYATWEFNYTKKVVSSSIKRGTVVSIKKGATYYNGADIPSWVMSKKWAVASVRGDRAVIDKSDNGKYSIESAINVKYLVANGNTTMVNTDTLDHYEVKWYFGTGDGVWYDGQSENVTRKLSTYNHPSNAKKVKIIVKPISKTYKKNGKETTHWSAESVSKTYVIESYYEPATPSAPTKVTIDKYTLTATLDNIDDPKSDIIYFYVVRNRDVVEGTWIGDKKFASGASEVVKRRALWSCDVKAGEEYRVCCRAEHIINDNESMLSDWGPYSNAVLSIPSAVRNLKCQVQSETSVKLTWDAVDSATSYKIEYTTNKIYFDSSSEVQQVTTEKVTNYIITGLDSGKKWYFRIKAVNAAGDAAWSKPVESIIGSKPEPPTTWSSTSTAVVGESVILYWVHNSEDGSRQMDAKIRLTIDGKETIITNPVTETKNDESDKIYAYTLNTSSYTAGAKIFWEVQTKGVTNEFSNWSIKRAISIYAPPTLSSVVNSGSSILSQLPLNISMTAGPSSQKVLSYHVSIIARTSYVIDDPIGKSIRVNVGDEIYSKNFDTFTTPFSVPISADSITLKNNQSYTVKTSVVMNSGMSASDSDIFTVSWSDTMYDPDASIALDRKTLSAHIRPRCLNSTGVLLENVTLGVYRREYDGSFTKIKTGIGNNYETVTDPHPSLDYARYRIIARNESTGSIGYSDIIEPFGISSIILQWDEQWISYDYDEMGPSESPPWSGSMIKLPYNIDVDESNEPDIAHIEYIGRSHPVSYFGTQRGTNAVWYSEIPKSDKETIFALRRLSAWMGNVYVREPSGIGYWATVTVSMPIKHLELTVPVTINIKRVEVEEI